MERVDSLAFYMLTGVPQADVALIVAPAEGNFTTATAKDTREL